MQTFAPVRHCYTQSKKRKDVKGYHRRWLHYMMRLCTADKCKIQENCMLKGQEP